MTELVGKDIKTTIGKESEKDCIYLSESLCCIPETNTTLQINYISRK